MRIKFLETTPSESPTCPFQAGQIIAVERLTPALRRAVTDGHAVLLEEAPERAALGAPAETSTESRPKAKGRR
jgi:hypothetical protein